jgi:hypothetical protein
MDMDLNRKELAPEVRVVSTVGGRILVPDRKLLLCCAWLMPQTLISSTGASK